MPARRAILNLNLTVDKKAFEKIDCAIKNLKNVSKLLRVNLKLKNLNKEDKRVKQVIELFNLNCDLLREVINKSVKLI